MKSVIILLASCALSSAQESSSSIGSDDIVVAPANPAIEARTTAYEKYYESKHKIKDEYRKQLVKAVIIADEVRLYTLSHKPIPEVPNGATDDYFPIKPYQSYSKIHAQKSLDKQDVIICTNLVAELLNSENEIFPFCHLPVHGIRLYRSGELIFESSICWHCGNYYVEYPDDYKSASFVGFRNQKLEEFMKKHMPLPENGKIQAEQAAPSNR